MPAGAVAGAAVARHAVPGAALDPAELFDIDVEQLAGMAALVAVRRLGRLQPGPLPSRVRMPETVGGGI